MIVRVEGPTVRSLTISAAVEESLAAQAQRR